MSSLPPSYDDVWNHPNGNTTRTAPQSHQFKKKSNLFEESPFPDIPDVICHLKLLKAFEVLKGHICYGLSDENAIESLWKSFVTNSVRRFIIFVSALRYSFPDIEPSSEDIETLGVNCIGKPCSALKMEELRVEIRLNKDQKLDKVMRNLLPPLDILMVWHAFLLNPKSIYKNFQRNNALKFLFIPFPLDLIKGAISDENFSYNPNMAQREMFKFIVNKYGYALTYDFNEPFIPENLRIPLQCPCCQALLGDVTLSDISNEDGSEFLYLVDSDKNCKCGFTRKITHDELRKRLLYVEVSKKAKPLIQLSHTQFVSDDLEIFELFNILEMNKNTSLSNITAKFCKTRGGKKYFNKISKEYFAINLIYLTIKKRNLIKISEDLVGSILLQESFTKKSKRIDWLNLPTLNICLQEANKRYGRFWELLVNYRGLLVPPLDIELFVTTHQLNFKAYMIHCLTQRALFVYQVSTTKSVVLNDSFKRTAKLYRKMFNESYEYVQVNDETGFSLFLHVLI